MNKLFAVLLMMVGVLMVGCGQQQESGKPTVSPANEENTKSANEQLMRAYQGACTRVRTVDEIKRGVPCK